MRRRKLIRYIHLLKGGKIDANCVENEIEKTKNGMNKINMNTKKLLPGTKYSWLIKGWPNGQLTESSLNLKGRLSFMFYEFYRIVT